MNDYATLTQARRATSSSRGCWSRRAVFARLQDIQHGQILLRDAEGVHAFGEQSGMRIMIRVHRPDFYRAAAWGGTLAVAESYLRGDWDCDDLTALFQIFLRNQDAAARWNRGWARLAGISHRLFHLLHANTRAGSRRNIHAHYDLGNEFFRLWLDDTLAYSCGIFESSATSLRAASLEKFDRVCRKLALHPRDHVLEIGSGWGGFALHAASQYGCRVTTTTISQEQYTLARQRISAAGLSDRVTLLAQDYRDLSGQFDKLVSIEMIEAVGHRHLPEYFRQCSRLLRPDGSMLLQAIVMPEQHYSQYLRSVDFIQRYVFPGGSLPSLGAILQAVGKATDLRLVHAEDLAPHYAETLRRWRDRFEARLTEVRQLGYSDELVRLWRYYLCYCEAAFEERFIGVLQVQFDKPKCRRDAISVRSHLDVTPTSDGDFTRETTLEATCGL